MVYVYIIKCNDNTLYTGIAKDINKRMKEHYFKLKNCAKYTRARDVVSLEALWETESLSDAAKLEFFIKKLKRNKKEEIIHNPEELVKTIENNVKPVRGITLEMCIK